MEAFDKYLQQFPHYSSAVIESVRPYVSVRSLEAGDYLLRQGKICKNIAFIEEGLLRLYYTNDGKEVTNCFCTENSITCSYTSLISQRESDIAIQAIEPSKLILLSYESLQKLYDQNIFWQQVGRLVAEKEFITAECHNRFLTDLSATEKYVQILENEGDLLQRVPLKYLATYLQISPETLSRIRNKVTRT
jgi:CRP-like cAMP-binding protein